MGVEGEVVEVGRREVGGETRWGVEGEEEVEEVEELEVEEEGEE